MEENTILHNVRLSNSGAVTGGNHMSSSRGGEHHVRALGV